VAAGIGDTWQQGSEARGSGEYKHVTLGISDTWQWGTGRGWTPNAIPYTLDRSPYILDHQT